MKLTSIIIAKNAEGLIKEAISSVSFADEVIVIDNESTDKTAAIAQEQKAIVYSSSTTSFSDLRTEGLKKAKGDWILYIDSDERVSPSLKKEIKEIVDKPKAQYGAFRLKRKNFYLGNHEWPTIEKIERFFWRDALKEWRGDLHESPIVDGEIGELDGYLLHYTHRDLASMLAKTIEWSEIEAQLRLKAGHPQMSWWRFFRVMATAFLDSYIKQGGWKIGTAGLIESIYQSFSIFVTYGRLWEMQQSREKKE